jgi:hypothetical protein
MGLLFAQLVPLILGAILAPIWIIIVLLLLASPQGLLKASAFVLGMTLLRLVQGLIFGAIFGSSSDNVPDSDGSTPIVSTLLLVVGILLLIMAYHKWRKEDDPDEPPPQWMQSFERISALQALGLGALLVGVGVKLWVFTLSTLSIISASDLGRTERVIAYLIYIVLAQSALLVSILVYALAPKAAYLLNQALDWLTRYNRPISMGVGLIFGLYFSYKGITGLLS